MKRIFKLLLCVIAIFIFSNGLSEPKKSSKKKTTATKTTTKKVSKKASSTRAVRTVVSGSMTDALNRLLASNNIINQTGSHLGIVVQSMSTGNILYQYHANELFTPASVQKLFTATAAIGYLKPDFHFATSLQTDGTISNGTLNGNLYVVFSGDPTLTTDQLDQLFNHLHHHYDVDRINGHVYIDNFAYDNNPTPVGTVWDDLTYNYAAPITAIIINHNQFSLGLTPGATNKPPTLKSLLPDGVARFSNEAITTSSYQADCPFMLNSNDQNVYRIKGCLNRRWGQQWRTLAIRNVVPYAQVMVWRLLQKNSIQYSSPITLRRSSPTYTLLAVNYSPALSMIVKKMVKDSDNIATNAVFRKLGESFYKKQSTWQNSVSSVKQMLSSWAKINFSKSYMADGAGLSRYNMVSPNQLVQLLNFVYHNAAVKPSIMVSLPIAGKDGTLGSRLPEMARGERVRAKTGSMKGVVSLAGYINTNSYGTVAFAIMVNNFAGSKRPYRGFEDQVVKIIADSSR